MGNQQIILIYFSGISFSMEECDTLCTKIVIMVNEQSICFGSPWHLKNKLSQGFTSTVRLACDDHGNAKILVPYAIS